MYDDAGLALLAQLAPGGTCDGVDCWTPLSDKGFRLRDQAGTRDGITALLLRSSATDKARTGLNGKGASLPDSILPLLGTVTVQLHNKQTGVCMQSAFDPAQVFLGSETSFRAVAH